MEAEGEVEVVYENSLGQMEMGVFLEEQLGPPGRALAVGWDGDRYLLLTVPGGGEGLAWASVWDSAEERDRFVTEFQKALPGLPAPATLQSLEVAGRPGAMLRVGLPGNLTLRVTEGPAR